MRKLGWVVLAIAVAGFILCGVVNVSASGQGESTGRTGTTVQRDNAPSKLEVVFSSPGSTSKYYYCNRYEFDVQKNQYTLYGRNDQIVVTATLGVGWSVFIGPNR